MIRFNKTITVSPQSNGQWRIDTDRGDQYNLTEVGAQNMPITQWWSMQHQSVLRGWQMDIFIKELTRLGYGEDFKIWIVNKPGGGLSQPHDTAIMYHTGMKLWVLTTQEHHWLQEGPLMATTFKKEGAIQADLLNPQHRRDIYAITDYYNEYYK